MAEAEAAKKKPITKHALHTVFCGVQVTFIEIMEDMRHGLYWVLGDSAVVFLLIRLMVSNHLYPRKLAIFSLTINSSKDWISNRSF